MLVGGHAASSRTPVHYPAVPIAEGTLRNSNGAGDTFVGATAAALVNGMATDEASLAAQQLPSCTHVLLPACFGFADAASESLTFCLPVPT